MTLVLFISSVLTYVCKGRALFIYSIYGIEEMTSVNKTSIILCGIEETSSVEKTSIIILVFGIKEKQLHCEKSFYCVFIVVRGMITS